MVWKAIPLKMRLLSFPFCVSVYLDIFSKSASIDEVRVLHMAYYGKSVMFRLFRPKFREIKRSIRSLLAPTSDLASLETTEAHRPIPWMRPPTTEASSESDTMRLLYERVGRLSMQLESQGSVRDECDLEIHSDDVLLSMPIRQRIHVGR